LNPPHFLTPGEARGEECGRGSAREGNLYRGRGDDADTGVVDLGGNPEPREATLRLDGDGNDVTKGDGMGEDVAAGGMLVGGAVVVFIPVAIGGGPEAAMVEAGGGAVSTFIPLSIGDDTAAADGCVSIRGAEANAFRGGADAAFV